jgi:hypothetical protein
MLSEETRESEYSKQGTAAHEALELLLEHLCTEELGEPTPAHAPEDYAGREMSNGYTLTAEDVIALRQAYNFVCERWQEALQRKPPTMEARPRFVLEHRVYPGKALTPPVENDAYGTLDIGIVSGGWVEVIDYKHGSGVLVSPDDPQLMCYALGLLKEVTPPEGQRIVTYVVQPRHRGWSPETASHTHAPQDLADFRDQMQAAVIEARSGIGRFAPSESACRWCPAKTECAAYASSALSKVQEAFGMAPAQEAAQAAPEAPSVGHNRLNLEDLLGRDAGELGLDEKAMVYENADYIRGWLKAIEQDLVKRALRGERVPMHKLVRGRRTHIVTDEEAYRKALSGATKRGKGKLVKADYIEEKLISPSQAEKRLKPLLTPKGWEKVEACLEWRDGNPALVSESDPRPELVTNAGELFGAVPPPKEMPDFLR